jgi:hypothetical protein
VPSAVIKCQFCFWSYHVIYEIYVISCHFICQLTFPHCHLIMLGGREEGQDQICLPMPLETVSLSGGRQKMCDINDTISENNICLQKNPDFFNLEIGQFDVRIR